MSTSSAVPLSTDEGAFSGPRPAFQRCHRLRARLEAVSAGLLELRLLRERQERLVREAMGLPLSPGEGEDDKGEVFEPDEGEVTGDTLGANDFLQSGGDPDEVFLDSQEQNQCANFEQRESTGLNSPDNRINSEASSRKSSGFFDYPDTDSDTSRKNSAETCPDATDLGTSRKQSQDFAGSEDTSRHTRTDSSSDLRGSAKQWTNVRKDSASGSKLMNNLVTAAAGLKRSSTMKAPSGLKKTLPEFDLCNSHSEFAFANRRPRGIQRSMSVQEPITNSERSHKDAGPITREEMLRRKRRSVHEIDFSLTGQPELAHHCFMGSSRAFRYPSPLHAISLQSPLCLPDPDYHSDEKQGCHKAQLSNQKSPVDDDNSAQNSAVGTDAEGNRDTCSTPPTVFKSKEETKTPFATETTSEPICSESRKATNTDSTSKKRLSAPEITSPFTLNKETPSGVHDIGANSTSGNRRHLLNCSRSVTQSSALVAPAQSVGLTARRLLGHDGRHQNPDPQTGKLYQSAPDEHRNEESVGRSLFEEPVAQRCGQKKFRVQEQTNDDLSKRTGTRKDAANSLAKGNSFVTPQVVLDKTKSPHKTFTGARLSGCAEEKSWNIGGKNAKSWDGEVYNVTIMNAQNETVQRNEQPADQRCASTRGSKVRKEACFLSKKLFNRGKDMSRETYRNRQPEAGEVRNQACWKKFENPTQAHALPGNADKVPVATRNGPACNDNRWNLIKNGNFGGNNGLYSADRNYFPDGENWPIDSSGRYNDGVVRSKTPVVLESLFPSETSRQPGRNFFRFPEEGMPKNSSFRENTRGSHPRRKNACVAPARMKQEEYEL